ncbi:major facilitator superfamily domain-containing protein [Chaetomium strumarium]|uniref:Major facilitator superfamily domain-containing protein n=1 Tax=Chaetomium strumarium TaxID=1170767 RepID=A0AAJ0GMR1_9PEZI|nr:major facilitator superfamily domain-containing protein [Chaetomium strumarium]
MSQSVTIELVSPAPAFSGNACTLVGEHGPALEAAHEPFFRRTSRPPAEGGIEEPDDTAGTEVTQRWNQSWTHIARVFSTFWCFFLIGANDAAYGALLPSLESYYGLDFVVISLVFLSPFAGYVVSAMSNNVLHQKIGQRGIAMVSAACHMAAYIIMAAHPPYVVLVIAFIIAGFGNGVGDSAWNAWIGSLANSNELLGFMHACYGVGGTLSPLVATLIVEKYHLGWYTFYYFMIGAAAIELVSLTWSFWSATGKAYRQKHRIAETGQKAGLVEALWHSSGARVSWICAIFLLAYIGVEVSLGGWIVTFMIQVRQGGEFASGMTATGFWLGITLGRIILGFVTPRVGVNLAIAVYLALTIGLEFLFWFVPQFYVSAVAVALQGFFLGPLFPGVVVVASKLLPKHLHVTVIGFASAFGGCGAALLPFAVGVLAQAAGVMVLQPIILALLVVMLGLWLFLPKVDNKRD